MSQQPARRLYFRSALQRALDDNKTDMGLMPAPAQDTLDHDLVAAVIDHHHRGVAEMVELGANVNRLLLSPVSGTLLHLAVQQGTLKTVVTLLQAGADPLIRDNNGDLARDIAARQHAQGHGGSGRIRTVLKLWEQRRQPHSDRVAA